MKAIIFVITIIFFIFSCEENKSKNKLRDVKIENKTEHKNNSLNTKTKINYAILFPQEYKIKQNDISFLKVNGIELERRNNDDLLKKKCLSWTLNKSQIIEVFTKSIIITAHEVHYLYNHYPCEMVGKIIIKNIQFNFYMNAGSFIVLNNKDTTLHLGCDNKTFFLDKRYIKEEI